MKTGIDGRTIIKSIEGVGRNLKKGPTGETLYGAYIDPVGLPTIGYGHKILPGEKFGYLTLDQVEALFTRDLLAKERKINPLLKVKVSQCQWDAIVSLTFNIGVRAFSQSTLLKLLNAGDVQGAAAQFDRWVFGTVNGKKMALPGLVKRREIEKHLFLRC